jgi:hypothetical protein
MADFRTLLMETADELGMSPRTLAAIISYETAGSFDPTKRGPTTQWGQHQGLIQFGEPQRAEYGVDMSSPEAALLSQLGRDGAVVKYFRKNGWQPGMSDLDAYSIVNAGAPGKYGASDANNGGAPGTVRDKVEKQFGPHYANADRLLGSESDYAGGAAAGRYQPPGGVVARPSTGADQNPARLAWAYANGKMSPEDAAMYEQGVAAGVFPKADKPKFFDPGQQPDPTAIYAATAMRQRTPFQPVALNAGLANATPWRT